MKIASVECLPVYSGWRKNFVFVRIETDAGVVGWGEVAVAIFRAQKRRGARAGPLRPGPAPGIVRGFIGNRPSRCNFLRASLRARRMASAFSRTLLSEGFS